MVGPVACGSGIEVGNEISKAFLKSLGLGGVCLDFPQAAVVTGELWPS